MKSFPLLLLGIVLVTGVPHKRGASEECKLQRSILAEIIEHVIALKGNLKNPQILVENVITPASCTCENFCLAGKVLSKFNAKRLGLNEKDWLLPRTLEAYSRNLQCSVASTPVQVQFHELLENIKLCAQKKYIDTSCDQMKHIPCI